MKGLEISIDGIQVCIAGMSAPSMLLAMIHNLETRSKSQKLFFVKGRQIPDLSNLKVLDEHEISEAIQAHGNDSVTWIEQTFREGQTIQIKVIEMEDNNPEKLHNG